MMISTKGRYALRVMAALAAAPEGVPVPLKEVAQEEQISEKYLEAIIKGMVKGGLVGGARGKGGGYRLAKEPGEIWQGLDRVIRTYFSGITLAQLAQQMRERPKGACGI